MCDFADEQRTCMMPFTCLVCVTYTPSDSLTPKQKRELAGFKRTVLRFEWFKTHIPYLRDFVPYLEALPDHIMTLGAFVRRLTFSLPLLLLT